MDPHIIEKRKEVNAVVMAGIAGMIIAAYVLSLFSCNTSAPARETLDRGLLVLRGVFTPDGQLAFQPPFISETQFLSLPQGDGQYSVELFDKSGDSLTEYVFNGEPMRVIGNDGSDRLVEGGIEVMVPVDEMTVTLLIRKGDREIATLKRSQHPPTFAIMGATERLVTGERTSIQWQSTDADGGPLWFMAEYSDDDGRNWTPLGGFFQGDRFEWDLLNYSGEPRVTLRIVCTDGWNTTRSSVAFVINRPFRIELTHPADRERGVGVMPRIYVKFSSPLLEKSVPTDALSLFDNSGNRVDGEVFYDPEDRLLIFYPAEPLQNGMLYRSVLDAVKSDQGEILSHPLEWHFSTGD